MDINFSNEEVRIDKEKRIFLAGPTRRNSSFENSWRNEACKILKELGFDGIVYIPEYSKGCQFDYDRQVLWERRALENSTKILFWIPRNIEDGMPAFTTNVEFGMYLARVPEKVILAYPENAEKNSYLKWLYNYETSKEPIFELRKALEEAIKEDFYFMKKNDLVGLVQILNCNLEDMPEAKGCTKEELEVFVKMQELKNAIEKLD